MVSEAPPAGAVIRLAAEGQSTPALTETLVEEIRRTVRSHSPEGMSIAVALGALEIVKHKLIRDQGL